MFSRPFFWGHVSGHLLPLDYPVNPAEDSDNVKIGLCKIYLCNKDEAIGIS